MLVYQFISSICPNIQVVNQIENVMLIRERFEHLSSFGVELPHYIRYHISDNEFGIASIKNIFLFKLRLHYKSKIKQ